MIRVRKYALALVPVVLVAVASFLSLATGRRGAASPSIWLPGTQPGQADTSVSSEICRACHAQIVQEWAGSMEAHAPRDPLFIAFLSITTKYAEQVGLDVGEYCLRCHTGSGWLAGRSHPGTVQLLRGSDLDGVNCDFCHRMADPLHPDGTAIVGGIVPGYGNGMYVVQKTSHPVRGARGIVEQCGPSVADPFYRASEYCAVCHEFSNPYVSTDPQHTPPHDQHPIVRTFSEWSLSWFATRGKAGTCQACHMKPRPGFATSFPPYRYRLDVASHDMAGGNTLAPLAVPDYWPGVNREALRLGAQRSVEILQTAASLDVQAGRSGEGVLALVRVMNLTGHKLPTGTPESRRLRVSVTGRNKAGTVVFQSGTYDSVQGEFLRDPQAKVYETISGMTPRQAAKFGKSPGASFLRSLNDTVLFDNRIPPRGFAEEAFRARRCAPVGYRYSDGQYWDVTQYTMGGDVESVDVSVWFQTADREFAEFLRDENAGNPYDWNDWGEKAYESWRNHGAPVRIASRVAAVQSAFPRMSPVSDFELPMEIRLAQNYPNPFNAETRIEYWLAQPGHARLALYDLSGREVARVVDDDVSAGPHLATVNAAALSSGVYWYRLSAQNQSAIKKLVFVR